MIRIKGKKIASLLCCVVVAMNSYSQATSGNVNLDKVNTITTAVPFIRIINDTRSGGMGDVGIAMSPDCNGGQINGAKMAFIDKDYGVGLSFTPWLKSLVNDIYLAQLTGYWRVKKVQTIHASFRYFSLGSIQYTNEQGENTVQVRPNELAADLGYSRRLGKIVSVGATLRFIYSNIAPQSNAGTGSSTGVTKPGLAGAADISVLVDKVFEPKRGDLKHELYWGLCLSNLGSKITYTSDTKKDFIPTNLGIGFGYKLHLDRADKHTVAAYLDFNKLLVPTPRDSAGKPTTTYKNQSVIQGAISSFYDAPGGAEDQIRQISVGFGAEYFYKSLFGIRMGYFYEDPRYGNRNFLTVGATLKYSVAALHLSYLIPTSNQRNPLDNTFRLSLAFEFAKGLKKKPSAESAESPATDAPAPLEESKPKKRKAVKAETVPYDPVKDATKQ